MSLPFCDEQQPKKSPVHGIVRVTLLVCFFVMNSQHSAKNHRFLKPVPSALLPFNPKVTGRKKEACQDCCSSHIVGVVYRDPNALDRFEYSNALRYSLLPGCGPIRTQCAGEGR